MATKARDVDWGELNDFKNELFDWLAERQLGEEDESSLSAVIALHQQPESLDPLVSRVVMVILKIEDFIGASRRADLADRARMVKQAGDDANALALFWDDTMEREADGAIRAIMPKLQHIRRLTDRIAERKVERERVRRQPSPENIDFSHDEVLQQLQKVEEALTALHLAFLRMNPCNTTRGAHAVRRARLRATNATISRGGGLSRPARSQESDFSQIADQHFERRHIKGDTLAGEPFSPILSGIGGNDATRVSNGWGCSEIGGN